MKPLLAGFEVSLSGSLKRAASCVPLTVALVKVGAAVSTLWLALAGTAAWLSAAAAAAVVLSTMVLPLCCASALAAMLMPSGSLSAATTV